MDKYATFVYKSESNRFCTVPSTKWPRRGPACRTQERHRWQVQLLLCDRVIKNRSPDPQRWERLSTKGTLENIRWTTIFRHGWDNGSTVTKNISSAVILKWTLCVKPLTPPGIQRPQSHKKKWGHHQRPLPPLETPCKAASRTNIAIETATLTHILSLFFKVKFHNYIKKVYY